MFSTEYWPSASSLFTTYVSVTASVVLAKNMANDLIPQPVRDYASSALRYFFKPRSKELTLVIDESNGIARNQIFEAAEVYLGSKFSPKTERLKISKTPKEKTISIRLEKNEEVVESFEGVDLKWRFIIAEPEKSTNNIYPMRLEKKSFDLTFHQKDKDLILNSYIPSVIDKAKEVREQQRILKMYTLNNSIPFEEIKWDAVNLEHPATFDTLAMERSLKHSIIEDLDRFVRRKDFYKRVGRAWKRGYLLYGPPGTGKSSLVAAMANHLKFDVYDLQLGNVIRDSDLRKLLLSTGNRSILVIEDIDCSLDLPDRRSNDADAQYQASNSRGAGRGDKTDLAGGKKNMLTLSGLLNFIDGLWSSCGDERIIIFTTNHKERLDPALLRPGRMDMHIHMSYCTFYGFKLLASNYLGITGEHRLYGEIEDLIMSAHITPARVAEEFMKSEDPDVALGGLVKLLKRKQCNGDADGDEDADEIEALEMKKVKKLKTDKGKAENKAKKTAGPSTRRKPARGN